MEFEQFHLESLGHASYLIGSGVTGEALVLDPRRDVEPYIEAATRAGLRIRYVVDSHQHNDYLSGVREPADRTGAQVLAGSEADVGYDHRPVKDGEQLELGDVGVEVLHTPGHTPEHISLLLYDGEQSGDEPAILLSGGALLVGDLARPDLLGSDDETRRSAEQFCRTIQTKLLQLPDHVLVYPTHVAGSLCGGAIGSRLATTIGYEKRVNEVLATVSDRDEFIESCLDLDDLPAVPPYWKRMRGQNQQGPALLGVVTDPPALQPDTFADLAGRENTIVVDARSPEAFAGAHIPGAQNVGLGPSFATWAGTVIDPDRRILLVLDDPSQLMDATWQLLRIGYDRPTGWLAGGMFAYRTTGRQLDRLPVVTVNDIADRLDELHVLDVRQPSEWSSFHAPDAQFITGAELPQRTDEVPRDRDVLVACGSGYRSSVAASLLRRHGHDRILNLSGGMAAWQAAGLPLTEAG
jgi:hydroxyacylglutathione hydrolase